MEGENLFPTPTKHKLGQVDVWTVHKKVDGSKYKLLYLYSFGIVVCPLLGSGALAPPTVANPMEPPAASLLFSNQSMKDEEEVEEAQREPPRAQFCMRQ
jgi:hypothetical protein